MKSAKQMKAIKAKSRKKNSIAISKKQYPTVRKAWTEAGRRTGWKPKDVRDTSTAKSFVFTKVKHRA